MTNTLELASITLGALMFAAGIALLVGCSERYDTPEKAAASKARVIYNPDGFSVGFEFTASNGALCVADWSMDSVSCMERP